MVDDVSTIEAAHNLQQPPQAGKKATTSPTNTIKDDATQRRPARPNYAKIHARPLPLEVFPLPAWVPHNPLSLFHILGAILGEYISRSSSHPPNSWIGHWSAETRSVHITDAQHVRALWEMGFFGKGLLSRSEPSWLSREGARRRTKAGGTSEENTSKRREERRMFKLERARAEREAIEKQLRREGKLAGDSSLTNAVSAQANAIIDDEMLASDRKALPSRDDGSVKLANTNAADQFSAEPRIESVDELDTSLLVDQEHLQLDASETFFLTYALGSLSVLDGKSRPLTTAELLQLFCQNSQVPPLQTTTIHADNMFLLSYVVYHHYRSLGWVVRSGSKFACDWLLYSRGPVFSHAEFAVIIVPEYAADWQGEKIPRRTWWDFHCINRVQSQVRKTLLLCYVDVPQQVAGLRHALDMDIGKLLRSYKVRDFVVKRWLANRSRD